MHIKVAQEDGFKIEFYWDLMMWLRNFYEFKLMELKMFEYN